MWLYCAPSAVTTLIRAPMPSRLLLCPLQLEFQPMMIAGTVVHPDFGRSADRGYDNVETAIAVEVPDCAIRGGAPEVVK